MESVLTFGSSVRVVEHSVRGNCIYRTYIFNSTKCSVVDCYITILVLIS